MSDVALAKPFVQATIYVLSMLSSNADMLPPARRHELGDAIEDIIADTRDAVGEITNMISGQARATLSEMGLPLQGSTPSIVFGANHSLSFPGQVTTVAIPFETDYGAFTLEFCFQ